MTDAPILRPIGPAFRANVRARIAAEAARRRLDGALFLRPANVLYACGFGFSVNERPVGLYVSASGEAKLFVPLLERENAEEAAGVDIETYEEFPGRVPPELWMAGRCGARRLVVDTLEARLLAPLQAATERVVLDDLAAPSRFVKTAEELALVRAAAFYADLTLRRLLQIGGRMIADGADELDIHTDATGFALAALKRDHGQAFRGTKLRITASVHSGPRAALPHGATGHRRPAPGETVICGVGCALGGIHAESGATFFVGSVGAEQRRITEAMQRCDEAAAAALRPGTPCEAVNEAALDALREAGLGDAIRHRIGHGMGVEGHEAPWLAPGDETPVASGMVFTSEPGVYRPGRDGYRTINTMIVGEAGNEIPSRLLADHPIDTRILSI